jgi:hypothetical protein
MRQIQIDGPDFRTARLWFEGAATSPDPALLPGLCYAVEIAEITVGALCGLGSGFFPSRPGAPPPEQEHAADD